MGAGFLGLDDFTKTLDENPWVSQIELSNYGEMFLNPSLLDIMTEAHRRGVSLIARNGVNLNTVGEDVLEGLVRCRFEIMTCSIDGATDETYRLYRVNGDFDTVIENIRKINRFKNEYRSRYPLLTWQFVVMGHNEHEIPAARKMARDLQMKFHLKLTWDDQHSPVHDKELLRREIGAASREEFRRKRGRDYMQQICHQLWDQPQINWDGRVLGCCRNFWCDFGSNAFREGLLKAVNSENMRYARDMLMGRNAERPGIPCTSCDIYLDMKAANRWLYRGSLRHIARAASGVSRLLRRK